ncbi:hypothetical protein DICA0_F29910 [Diutina catenulata]
MESTGGGSQCISTTDHLPCDIVRSLWLTQSLNLSVFKVRDALDAYLRTRNPDNDDEEAWKYVESARKRIEGLCAEASAESAALTNHLAAHRATLLRESAYRQRIKESIRDKAVKIDQDELRQQLVEHYAANPLVSHQEAVETGEKPGLKLVFKIPSSATVVKRGAVKPKRPRGRPRLKKSNVPPPRPEARKPKPVKTEPTSPRRSRGRPPKSETSTESTPAPSRNHREPTEELYVEPEPEPVYCFCKTPSQGNMIACDNESSCPNGEWFHYKCVGLLNRVQALKYTTGNEKWYCSDACRQQAENKPAKPKAKKRARRRNW